MLNSAFTWTDDARAEAVEMWQDGRSISQIAEFFTISRGAVSGYISRNRELFAKRPSGETTKAKTERAAAKSKTQAAKTRWTDEVVEKASLMWRVGLMGGEIADAIGCSESAFYEFTSNNRDKFPKRLKAREPVVKSLATGPALTNHNLFDSTGYQLPGVQPIAFVAIGRGECRFPINSHDSHNGPEMPCCGSETGGMVYCPAHMSIARGRGTESERTAHRAFRRVA